MVAMGQQDGRVAVEVKANDEVDEDELDGGEGEAEEVLGEEDVRHADGGEEVGLDAGGVGAEDVVGEGGDAEEGVGDGGGEEVAGAAEAAEAASEDEDHREGGEEAVELRDVAAEVDELLLQAGGDEGGEAEVVVGACEGAAALAGRGWAGGDVGFGEVFAAVLAGQAGGEDGEEEGGEEEDAEDLNERRGRGRRGREAEDGRAGQAGGEVGQGRVRRGGSSGWRRRFWRRCAARVEWWPMLLKVTLMYWMPMPKAMRRPVKSSRVRRVESQRSIQAKTMRMKNMLFSARAMAAGKTMGARDGWAMVAPSGGGEAGSRFRRWWRGRGGRGRGGW